MPTALAGAHIHGSDGLASKAVSKIRSQGGIRWGKSWPLLTTETLADGRAGRTGSHSP
jgi:hypothetical protein